MKSMGRRTPPQGSKKSRNNGQHGGAAHRSRNRTDKRKEGGAVGKEGKPKGAREKEDKHYVLARCDLHRQTPPT